MGYACEDPKCGCQCSYMSVETYYDSKLRYCILCNHYEVVKR